MKKRHTLETRLFFTFVGLICLVCAVCILFIRVQIIDRIESSTLESHQQLCVKISENIDTYVEKMDDIAKRLLSSGRLIQILREEAAEEDEHSDYEELQLQRELSNIVSASISLTAYPHVDIYLYDTGGNFSYAYFRDKGLFGHIRTNEDYLEKLGRKKLVIYAEEEMISFVRAVYDIGLNLHGYIEVQADCSELEAIADLQSNGEVLVLDENGDSIFRTAEFTVEKIEKISEKVSADGSTETLPVIRTIDGEMIFAQYSSRTCLTTYICYPTAEISASVSLLYRTMSIFVLIVIVSAFVMSRFMLSMILKPLKELRRRVQQVTYQNLGVDFDNTDHDEVNELRDAFQKILNDLKVSAERENEAKQAELKSRLKALQAQISPHFIHNVLYLISISAKENRTEDAVQMCKQLSNMLRYTVDSESPEVLLKDELACIENYLSLQKNYYEDFLQYTVQIEPALEELAVPRLCILPFVENAIHHAFEGCVPPYQIGVFASFRERQWIIEISDNGAGFTEEEKQRLEQRIRDRMLAAGTVETDENRDREELRSCVGGIGVVNSVWRLRYFYGDSFSFEILQGQKERGTIIRLSGICRDGDGETRNV